jgi:hypothetical protein
LFLLGGVLDIWKDEQVWEFSSFSFFVRVTAVDDGKQAI